MGGRGGGRGRGMGGYGGGGGGSWGGGRSGGGVSSLKKDAASASQFPRAPIFSAHTDSFISFFSARPSILQGYGGMYDQGGYGGYGAPYGGGPGGGRGGPAAPLHGPNGWTMYRDPQSGDYYYHNHNTGLTQWERPADWTGP